MHYFISTNLVILFSITLSLSLGILSVIKYILIVNSFVGCGLYLFPMFLMLLILLALFWALKYDKKLLMVLLYVVSGLIIIYQLFLCIVLFAISSMVAAEDSRLLNSLVTDLIKFFGMLIKDALFSFGH